MGKMNALQLEVDALQAKVDAEKMAKSKREKIKKLNMDVEGKRSNFMNGLRHQANFLKNQQF